MIPRHNLEHERQHLDFIILRYQSCDFIRDYGLKKRSLRFLYNDNGDLEQSQRDE